MSEVTWVDKDICVCDNCGAYAKKETELKHHKTCRQGESKRWEKIYEEASEDDLPF